MIVDADLENETPRYRCLRLAGRHLLAFSTVPVLAVLIWLGVHGRTTRHEVNIASQQAVRVAELRGTIAHLDEWLVMSARMAASSGESRWAERYAEAAPKLDAAISEASDIAAPDARASFAATTGEAHRDLATMERRALEFVAGGDLAAARALLNGPEFAYLQDVYATGIDAFGQQLRILSDQKAADLDSRAWLEGAALAISAVLLVATTISIHGRTRLKRALAQTAAVARTDPLTGLPNRRRFHEQLDAALLYGNRTGLDHALALIDLDRFKAANDAYGHPAGDELLQLVAARLKSIVGDEQILARLGGDEFAVVLRCDPANSGIPRTDPADLATRIVDGLGKPFCLRTGSIIQIGASAGIGVARAGSTSASEVMHAADVALYRAKSDGRGCIRFFENGLDAHVRMRALMETELRQAVANGAMVAYFQPLVALQSEEVVGVEMLARWPHPTRGMVPPSEFIPVVEDLGLIGLMTEQLLRRACCAAALWPDHVTLACNISPLQLRDSTLPEMIQSVLRETGFPPGRLELEITENAFVGDLDLACELLNQLKLLGVRLALDDFGTGYSSLRHLQTLPFDKIKIDRSFVSAMTAEAESGKIVAAVLALARSLGLTTTAEGVETVETASLLRMLGCDVGQGWLYGRPISAEDLASVWKRVSTDLATSAPESRDGGAEGLAAA